MTLSLHDIHKRFGPVVALAGVSLDVPPGEVHALLGENGAGKTTLVRIAAGMLRADAGAVEVIRPGVHIRRDRGFATPAEARAAQIGMVHQHFTSIAALSVAENIALSAGWRETGRRAERRASALIGRMRLPVDPAAPAGTLSVQLRQRLEIVKALASNARILLLDEPSAVLAPREIAELLRLVREFADAGGAAVLITHKLDEVFLAADRVTVLRHGAVTLSGAVTTETRDTLARAMLGDDLPREAPQAVTPGEVVVRAAGVSLADGSIDGDEPARSKRRARDAHSRIDDASFEWRAGEIVGIAAIEGNGQRELLRAVAGLPGVSLIAGTLQVSGPVAFVPEDRTVEGLILSFTLTENVLLGGARKMQWWTNWHALEAGTRRLMTEFDIRAAGPDVAASGLSGGNQQKLILARALDHHPRVLVAEDPTRGLDVRATQSIHTRLREAAAAGVLVVVHSPDLDEVLGLASRLFVIANGDVTEVPAHATRDVVGDAMLGLVRTA